MPRMVKIKEVSERVQIRLKYNFPMLVPFRRAEKWRKLGGKIVGHRSASGHNIYTGASFCDILLLQTDVNLTGGT